jgi:serine/threonine protein kinase
MRRGLPELGETIASKYLVTGTLGRGGMGAVYVVEHRLTGKRLAVKCLLPEHLEHPELVERFLREAQAAGRIQHRYVVDVFDVGRDGELLYIVMELLEGKTLADLLRDASLPLEDILTILLRAMEGVAAAHATGIVHRDLKPENVIVLAGHSGRYDDPRVLDFGISKLEEDASRPLTRSGVMMGTPYYMSFEQISSQRDLDQRVDVYAMGVILYEALSGRVPYVAESVGALAVRMLTTPPEPLSRLRPDLPPELVEVVMRSIARDRDERYPTIRALIEALAPFTAGEVTGVMERPSKALGRAAGSTTTPRVAGGEEPTLLVTPARPEARNSSPARAESRSSGPTHSEPRSSIPTHSEPRSSIPTHSEPRSSIPSQRSESREGRLIVFDDDEEARPETSDDHALPVGKLVAAGAALLLGVLLTVLLWPSAEPEQPAQSAPAAGGQPDGQGQRVVVPGPSRAQAPPPAAPAEPAPSAAPPPVAPVPAESALDSAAVDTEAEGDVQDRKGGAAKRRRGRETRTLDQMVPQAPPPRAEEREDPQPAPAQPAPAPAPAPVEKAPPPSAEPHTDPLPTAPKPDENPYEEAPAP